MRDHVKMEVSLSVITPLSLPSFKGPALTQHVLKGNPDSSLPTPNQTQMTVSPVAYPDSLCSPFCSTMLTVFVFQSAGGSGLCSNWLSWFPYQVPRYQWG